MRMTGLAVIPAMVCGLCAASPPASVPVPESAVPVPGSHEAPALSGNPMAANKGFGVVTRRDALLGGTSSESAIAVGGGLALGSRYTIAPRAADGFRAAGDARPTALLVDGAVDFSDSAADGVLRVTGDRYVKVGDLSGSATRATGMDGTPVKTRLVPAGAGYGTTPRVELTTAQPPSSVGPVRGLLDFGTLFAGHRQRADALARCRGTVAPPADAVAPDGTVRVRLADRRTNVLRLTGAQLARTRVLAFENRPTAARPLVIVVDTTAEGGELSWRTPTMTGIGRADAPYVLWTFADATDLALTAGDTLRGSLYAPRAELTDGSPAGIEGDIVVRSLKAGPLAGAIHSAPFAAEPTCDTPAPRPAAPGPERAREPGPLPDAPADAEPPSATEPEAEAEAGSEAQTEPVPETESETDSVPDPVPLDDKEPGPGPGAEPAAEPESATPGEMADTGTRPKLWLLGAGAALLVATGTVLTRASRRKDQSPGE